MCSAEIIHVTCLAQCPARSQGQVGLAVALPGVSGPWGGGFLAQAGSARTCSGRCAGPLALPPPTRGAFWSGPGVSPSAGLHRQLPSLALGWGVPLLPDDAPTPTPRLPAGCLFMFVAVPPSFLLGLGCPVWTPPLTE